MNQIAARHGVSVQRLISANPQLKNATQVLPGNTLTIPRDSFESAPAPRARAVLQQGSTGPQVRELQKKLVAHGAMTPSELSTGPGVFGPRTARAVRQFQQERGLPQTGVVGDATRAALDAPAYDDSGDITQPMALQIG